MRLCRILGLLALAFPPFAWGEQASCAYPVNSQALQVQLPDGSNLEFTRCVEPEDTFGGPYPWVARDDGENLVVATDDGFAGEKQGYVFTRGLLAYRLLKGRVNRVRPSVPPRPAVRELLAAQRPSQISRMWREGNRTHLWYDNPNAAGALLALLALMLLGFGLGVRPLWARIPCFLLCLAVTGVMLSTQSRSALLAFAAGFLLQLGFACSGTLWKHGWKLALAALLVLALAFAGAAWSGHAFSRNLLVEGYSETSRLPIWIEVPRMILSAPAGWGWGNSGTAYINWFQPLERTHVVRALVSSHLTWLVEGGWLFRVCYVAGWGLVLAWLFRVARRGRDAMPLAVWTAFFIVLFFNHVGEYPSVCAIPVLVLAAAFLRWRLAFLRPIAPPLVFAAIAVLAVWGGVVGYAVRAKAAVPVRGRDGVATIGKGDPRVWVVGDHCVLDGGYWGQSGKDVRRYYAAHPMAEPLGYTEDIGKVPSGGVSRLVLAGRQGAHLLLLAKTDPSKVPAAESYVFLSPPFGPEDVPDALKAHDVCFVLGSLVRPVSSRDGHVRVETGEGSRLYFPDWIERCLYD